MPPSADTGERAATPVAAPTSREDATDSQIRAHWTLRRLERRLVRTTLEHPHVLGAAEVRRLRYLLGFARLTEFVPGVARAPQGSRRRDRIRSILRRGGAPQGEVSVVADLEPFRALVIYRLTGPLREESDPVARLRHARAALADLAAPLEQVRGEVIANHGEPGASGGEDMEDMRDRGRRCF